MATDSDVVEYAKIVPVVAETGDSCITRPVNRATDDYCTPGFTCAVPEVKKELLQDVKMEDADEHDTADPDSSVKVRLFALFYNAVEACCISWCIDLDI